MLECVRSWVRTRSDITKDYKIGICSFSAKRAALRGKSKDWLAWNHDNVSMLFQHKNPTKRICLVQNGSHHHHLIKN